MDIRAADTAGPGWLASAADRGEVHTVRLGWADRLGGWRGKRMPVREFLSRAPLSMGFCDGMIVCDVQCDVIEATPFSNYSTGYPDLHVHFLPELARLAAWAPGEAFVFGVPRDAAGRPLDVAPAAVLAQVLHRLDELRVRVQVRACLAGAALPGHGTPAAAAAGPTLPDAHSAASVGLAVLEGLAASGLPATSVRGGLDPGSFVLGLGPASPAELAEALVVAKSAAREIAGARGHQAVFMTLRPGAAEASLLALDVAVTGVPPLSAGALQCRFDAVRPLLFPSVTAMKAHAPAAQVSDGPGGAQRVLAHASSEADPATAIAVLLAAVGSLTEASPPGSPGVAAADLPIRDLRDAAAMADRPWVTRWLGTPFVANAIPLFEHEAELFQAAVTDWEIARYWSAS
jgi:glutamine synthetase